MLLTVQPGAQHLSQGSGNGNGTIYSADVLSIQGARRRKRTELAVAFDNKLELHDISTGSKLKEYSIPDQEVITCQPASVRQKRADGGTRRISYIASQEGKKCRIHGRLEDSKRTLELSMPLWLSKSKDNPIASIEIHSSSIPDEVCLFALFRDGQAVLLSEDLTKQYWQTPAMIKDEEIKNVFSLSLEQARTGVLKNREDILARLDAMNASSVLALITNKVARAGSITRLSLLSVQIGATHTASTSSQTGLQVLFEQDVPGSAAASGEASQFYLHKSSGRLIEQRQHSLALYNLDGPVLKLDQTVPLEETIESCIPLSNFSIVITTSHHLTVLDTKYGAIKASVSFKSNDSEGQKTPNGTAATRVLAYFAPSSTIVTVQAKELQLFRLSNEGSEGNSKATSDSTLAAAMGRGIAMRSELPAAQHEQYVPPKFGTLVTSKAGTVGWNDIKKQLIKAAKEGRVDDFDGLCIEHFKLRGSRIEDRTVRRDWKKIYALLNMLLRPVSKTKDTEDTQSILKLKMTPPMTVGWLVHDGHFTQHKVEAALKHSGKLPLSGSLKACTLIDAVHSHDPSLQTLIFYLSSQIHLTAPEIAQTTLHALQVLQQAHNEANKTKLLKSKPEKSDNSDVDMEDATGEPDRTSSESPSPEPESEKAHDAHALMRICLSRLAALPSNAVQDAFKTTFSQPFLLAFIDYLRLDLASGGWYSHHGSTDPNFDDTVSQPADHIRTVSLLLSAAIDSLGSAGWLGASGENNIAERVVHMKAEISVALEGIEEAAYLQGILNEVLMYAKHEPAPPAGSGGRGLIPGHLTKRQVTQLETLTAPDGTEMVKPITVGLGDGEKNSLPVGLKPINKGLLENTDRVNAGGEVRKRSLRDIGRLKSMQVGAYSFERIMI